MALLVLFVSMGWNINSHYCTEDNHLLSSFGDASLLCEHCHHHTPHHHDEVCFHEQQETHFDTKCCCEDFENTIQFTDNYTFSSDKNQCNLLCTAIIHPLRLSGASLDIHPFSQQFSAKEIPLFTSGRQMVIFFSNLKLNPFLL